MSADARLVLWITTPMIISLIMSLAVCLLLLASYRRKNKSLRTMCLRYQDMAKTAEHKARRAQIAYCLAETQAAVEMAHKNRELKVNRELMKQFDRSRRAREEGA